MYGKYFKQLRKKQDISLKDAAANVISTSQLSRWENGRSNISFETVINLLDNIHIRANEFIMYCNLNPTNSLTHKIFNAYQRKGITELKHLTLKQIKQSKTSKNRFDLFLAVAAANFYFDLTNIRLISKFDILNVKSILSSTSYWNYYYISVWGNTLAFYDPTFNFKIASRILTILKNQTTLEFGTEYYTWCTILNALIRIIPEKIELAKKLSLKINKVSIPNSFLSIRLKKRFMDIYIKYQLHESDKEELNKFLYSLENLQLIDLKNELEYFLSNTKMRN
ncbi:helix-turn-helix transcriptional regulator [Lactobacillus crispatus]|uniref:Helix-turn-helix transcriptional regulator n=1 Tax=Lactobacillus crispatus TaxID=47770 RepID=A0A5M9Z1W3_9LACO|nr:helix-turn-helix transcriptional regulator [Lactobacillus crispatus]KAA8812233.1 helix-turn-helix transcriptional regulator [Lactobacillus crispatus]KRK33389.1 transcriptional regulator [Lactobacillus crispatus DSM 20584 = JCM 1185 = ATCC 33820]MBW9143468.1 helix-turn-helix domain-containing protein [Lactobacillus crispatus]MDK6377867.1 helix-turn-helix transcriptional regulator [Lactobacillus crispatus]MDK8509572.1 helix-turn-helix transcriptional regulator [Lactobacillus crispatus]